MRDSIIFYIISPLLPLDCWHIYRVVMYIFTFQVRSVEEIILVAGWVGGREGGGFGEINKLFNSIFNIIMGIYENSLAIRQN